MESSVYKSQIIPLLISGWSALELSCSTSVGITGEEAFSLMKSEGQIVGNRQMYKNGMRN